MQNFLFFFLTQKSHLEHLKDRFCSRLVVFSIHQRVILLVACFNFGLCVSLCKILNNCINKHPMLNSSSSFSFFHHYSVTHPRGTFRIFRIYVKLFLFHLLNYIYLHQIVLLIQATVIT